MHTDLPIDDWNLECGINTQRDFLHLFNDFSIIRSIIVLAIPITSSVNTTLASLQICNNIHCQLIQVGADIIVLCIVFDSSAIKHAILSKYQILIDLCHLANLFLDRHLAHHGHNVIIDGGSRSVVFLIAECAITVMLCIGC